MRLLENAKVLAGGLEPAILSREEKQMSNLLENCKRLDYDPDQPRDENGRWGDGGSGSTLKIGDGGNRYTVHRVTGAKWNDDEGYWDDEGTIGPAEHTIEAPYPGAIRAPDGSAAVRSFLAEAGIKTTSGFSSYEGVLSFEVPGSNDLIIVKPARD